MQARTVDRPERNRSRVAATIGGKEPAVEATRTSWQRVTASRLRWPLQRSRTGGARGRTRTARGCVKS